MAETNTADTATAGTTTEPTTLENATEAAKGFIGTAQEAITGALDRTIEAVKENPLTAAGIAAGAAAAVAGAAFGVSKLLEDDAPAKKPGTAKK